MSGVAQLTRKILNVLQRAATSGGETTLKNRRNKQESISGRDGQPTLKELVKRPDDNTKNNRESRIRSASEWIKRNQGKVNEAVRNRRANSVTFNLAEKLRSRIYRSLKRNLRPGSAVRDLGCTVEELKAYLEAMFASGMSWDNHGSEWELDHIIPLASFDLTDREQFLKACHYTNLQPLWKAENRSKSDKVVINGVEVRGRHLRGSQPKPSDNDNNVQDILKDAC